MFFKFYGRNISTLIKKYSDFYFPISSTDFVAASYKGRIRRLQLHSVELVMITSFTAILIAASKTFNKLSMNICAFGYEYMMNICDLFHYEYMFMVILRNPIV